VGIDGSPSTNFFSIHSGIGKNMGLGGGVILDKASFVSRFSAKLSYSYRIKLGEDHNLRFGLSAGLFQINLNATNAVVDDVTDEIVSGGAQSGINFDSEFGIFYNLKGLELGVSIPQVFETEAEIQFEGIDGFTSTRHFVAYAGYDKQLNEKWSVEPSVLYKTAQSGLNQFDFNGMVTFNDMISVGAGYRTHIGIIARLGLNIKDLLYLGYAYEFAGANISSYSTGSHEIMLGVKFCKDAKDVEPTSSFETTEEITPMVEEEIVEEPIVEEEPIEDPVVEEVVEDIIEIEELETPEESNFKETFEPEILFPYNDGENFDLASNDDLKELAEFLKSNSDEKIMIKGHACNIGSSEDNIVVSKARAQKVYNELISMGVSADQMIVMAMGESEPKYPNDSDENRKKNRRVEIVFE
jgi:type IX secretion system PorP/SprF family membrane protein